MLFAEATLVKQAIIIGAGGHGRVILDILRKLDSEVMGFLDDNPDLTGKSVNSVPVLGTLDQLGEFQGDVAFIIGIGDNYVRAKKFGRLLELKLSILTAIHPQAILANDVKIGKGVVIMAGAVVNTGTVIGDDVCMNTGATVDHDNILGDHSHIFPGATLAGGVKVGEFAYIGSGAVILPYLSVGENAYVGAGAVVTKDVPPNAVVAGVPAKVLKYRDNR